MSTRLDRVLMGLELVKKNGSGYMARCPAHDDHNPSLSITEGDDGRVLLKCHAGCTIDDICAGMHLEKGDLFERTTSAHEIVATYDYVDEHGDLLYQVVRYRPKGFRQRRPDGDGWIWNLNGTRRVPFRLPEVRAAVAAHEMVIVVEGEKDVLTLENLGFTATTSPGGAGKWSSDYAESLRGAEVVVIPDNDEPGRQHAAAVKATLPEAVIVSLDVPEKGDVSDWVAAGGTATELRKLITAVVRATKPQRSAQTAAELAALLDDVAALLGRFVIFPDEATLDAVALWTAHTHVYEQMDITPYLTVTSAERRSGKTVLFECLALLVPRPWATVTPSEAVTFRRIERDAPTILLDEVDCVFNKKAATFEGLRALLNAGFQKGTKVSRCVGDKMALQDFATYCPKALAGIGYMIPETVTDRSIPVRLKRAKADERPERFRRRVVEAEFAAVRERLEHWAAAAALGGDYPELPHELSARAQDVWEPLLAIAERAGEEWKERGTIAAVTLSLSPVDPSPTLSHRLLADIREVFNDKAAERLMSTELVGALKQSDDGFWCDAFYGKALTASRLKKVLAEYGITAHDLRVGQTRQRGYRRQDFEDAWSRYI